MVGCPTRRLLGRGLRTADVRLVTSVRSHERLSKSSSTGGRPCRSRRSFGIAVLITLTRSTRHSILVINQLTLCRDGQMVCSPFFQSEPSFPVPAGTSPGPKLGIFLPWLAPARNSRVCQGLPDACRPPVMPRRRASTVVRQPLTQADIRRRTRGEISALGSANSGSMSRLEAGALVG